MNSPLFGDIVKFVLDHKGTGTFMNMSHEQIVHSLWHGLCNETLYCATNNQGVIVGMILAEKRQDEGILFVTENLAMNRDNLKLFATKAKKQFPGLQIEWLKRGIHKKHNTYKLYKKLGL